MSFAIFNQPSKASLVLHVVLFFIVQIIITSLVFGLGWDAGSNPLYIQKPYVSPPGALVATVWIVLFFCMSIARWEFNKHDVNRIRRPRIYATLLLIWCALYPFFTFAIDSVLGGIIGNAGIFVLSALIIHSSWNVSKRSSYLIIPVFLWITFASTIIISELGYL